jgi:parallel beta-helix repeat protein
MRADTIEQRGKASQLTNWKPVVVGGVAVSSALLGVGYVGGAAQAAPGCTPDVGHSGLSAAVVAQPHQKIAHRAIDATGCDIGIYVGRHAGHVTINWVSVTGANAEGILAEKTSHLTVKNSTLTGNGFKTTDPSAPPLPGSGVHSFIGQAFAISLFGVSYSTVKDNTVTDNGRGGIGVMDNGANDPGTLTQHPKAPLIASTHDNIVNNHTSANYNGCGLVVATQNLGGRLAHLRLVGNTITGTGMDPTNGPDIGGIVVAADPPNSSVKHVSVRANTVTDSFEGGVIVNAEAFNSFTSAVHVTRNTVVGNNWGDQEAPDAAGVIVFADPGAQIPPNQNAPVNRGTKVWRNHITNQFYGVYSMGDFQPRVYNNDIVVTPGGTPVFHG